ncbi:MAG: hypothetical protein LBV69_12010 [Bacteroidales bacterium]|jgi:hypothetical protein|nr:hypothetical protein [Bacteroidales bacterium]
MKRLKLLKFIVLLSFLLILVACPKKDYKHVFRFSNNSNVDVYIYLGVVNRDLGGTLYPDTAIAEVRCGVLFKKGESRYYSYNYEYNNGYTNVLSLFIFNADTFDTYSWDEIKNDYKILRRYDLSLQDIEMSNYMISYPPAEAMKDIKMWPPYEE